ncbi:glycosyltransferase family protein [Cohnella cholangitidis]|uniref:Glycosyltransferase family 4 protein n=1 Tax=Cohnella cholangitidis TaxID=2598458 RepID=A0A7G5BUY5_9BACL|nr:glycosyltransferase [Cohnella cholangitidis]QMV40769.1 glycosyltransferase family 4 protein [Cohnella cholangitidis]
MGRRGDINVLIIGSERIASYKIGLEQPLRHLEKHGVCSFSIRSDDEVQLSRLAAADIVIFFRTVSNEAYKLLELAREMGKKTVYVIDDHFMAMSPASEMGNYYHDPNKRANYVKFLKNTHIVKVASKFFARHLETHFNPNKIVCFAGSVDFSIFSGLEKSNKHEDKIVIGYEGGKKLAAFDPVIDALRGILRTYGEKIRIEFFGYIPDGLVGKPQVFYNHHDSDYRNFLKSLYRLKWDIGLAPLENTLLHDCKTNNKFREYAACRIPGIYSKSKAYEDWVEDGENGMLASGTRDDWYEAMAELIEKPDLREKIKDRAETAAKEHFSVETCAENWRNQIFDV